jgi:hypothetical protein
MPPLPRGRCPVCGADVALRKGGLVREHRVYRPQLEQDPSTHLGRTRVCDGSARAVVAVAGPSFASTGGG